VIKGYISQILKGEFNYTLKKLIELSLAINKVPQIEYKSVEQVINDDKGKCYINLSSSSDLKVNEEVSYTIVTDQAA
jgi:hypothetical protein